VGMTVGEAFSQISWQIVAFQRWWTWMINLVLNVDEFTREEG